MVCRLVIPGVELSSWFCILLVALQCVGADHGWKLLSQAQLFVGLPFVPFLFPFFFFLFFWAQPLCCGARWMKRRSAMTAVMLIDQERRRSNMWYFAWLLGLPLAAIFAAMNAMWYELMEENAKKAEAKLDR